MAALVLAVVWLGSEALAKAPEEWSRPLEVGEKAPDFTLPDTDGNSITLSRLLASPSEPTGSSKTNGVVLIFYRGHW